MICDEGGRFGKILIRILPAAVQISLSGITRKRSIKKLAAVLSFTLLFIAAGAVSRVGGQEVVPGASLEERESALLQQAVEQAAAVHMQDIVHRRVGRVDGTVGH